MDNYSNYIGLTLDNRYKIKSLIGNGGMAHVFLADDTVMNRPVAVKILKETFSTDELSVKRFVNESTAISMLKHENIVSVYDVSVLDDIKYIVMEYVDGISLKKHMENKGLLPFAETESIVKQILSALAHAHSKGIIHRDIKPQNIMIYHNGTVKVADFGIAKIPGSETISLYDKAIGTVSYINPEQACGKSIDARSDIYSLGTMLYEMVTGKVPFVADSPVATAYMQIHEKPIKPSEINENVPKGLEQIILKAMKKSPDNRFQSASEMLLCLERVTDNPEVTFDFVFDEEAEKEPFPQEEKKEDIAEVFSNESVTVIQPKKKAQPQKPVRVQKINAPKKKKQKKIVEIEEVVVRKKSKVSMLCVVLGVIAAVFCVCLVAVLYVFENYIMKSLTTNDSVTITVGDYMYQTYSDELLSDLESKGYEVTIEWITSDKYLANTIVSQNPEADTDRVIIPGERYCQLILTVCSGEDLIKIDNYTGMDHREAMIHMNARGLNVKIEKQINAAVEEGKIINTYPSAGSVVTSDTLITVYVSEGNGNEYITVPDFRNMNSIALELALIKYNLTIGNISYSYSDNVDAGCVISQNMIPGTTAPAGITKIDFVVSLGPDPTVNNTSPADPTLPTVPDINGSIDKDPDNSGFEG